MEKQNILFLIEQNKYSNEKEIEKFNKLKDFIIKLSLESNKEYFVKDFSCNIKDEKVRNLYKNIYMFDVSEEAIENIMNFKFEIERRLRNGKLRRLNISKTQIIMYKDMDYDDLLNLIFDTRLKDFTYTPYLITTVLKDSYQNFNVEKNYSFIFDFNKMNKTDYDCICNSNNYIKLPEDIKTSILNYYNKEYKENDKIKDIFWSCENNTDILNFIFKVNRNEELKINKKILSNNSKFKNFLLLNNIKTGLNNFIRETKKICNDDSEIKENLYELNRKITKICNDLEISLKKNIISNDDGSDNSNKLDFSPESKKLIESIENFIINN